MDCMEELIWSFIIGVHVNLKNCKNIFIIQIQLIVGTATLILKILATSLWC